MKRALAVVGVLAVVGALLSTAPQERADGGVRVEHAAVEVPAGPGASGPIRLDTSLYLPAATPAPAVLLAHGFGADKHAVDAEAVELAEAGFVVQTYSARGFGDSGGLIGLNDPDGEVADARRLLDRLAGRPEVLLDAPGDPRVGVTGVSYGGALALMLAGSDPRVDSVAPVMTYNDLALSLAPNSASGGAGSAGTPAEGPAAADGVFKRAWAGILFSAGADALDPARAGSARPCGRFTEAVCRAYTELATTGALGEAGLAALHRLSPTSVTDRISAPTLLVQGESDTLFGLDQADATARQLHAAGAPVQVVWFAGGHDAGKPDARLRADIGGWLRARLSGDVPDPFGRFHYDVQGAVRPEGAVSVRQVRAESYPGLGGPAVTRHEVPVPGDERIVVNPPGGSPSAISAIPGVDPSVAGGLLEGVVGGDPPGQSAGFRSEPVDAQLLITGSTTARLRVSSTDGGGGLLFARLYDVAPTGARTLPSGAVAPLRLPDLPADGTAVEVTVTLPGVVRPVEAGHRLELSISTTDLVFDSATEPAAYRVSVVGPLRVPVVAAAQVGTALPVGSLLGLALVAVAVLVALLVARARRGGVDFDPALADTPLLVEGLVKRHQTGAPAVDGLDLRAERGQVVALLGPNGAGKSTTLCALLGLTTPTEGVIRVFGHRVRPGAPVLSRVGAFVEGAGFLPELTGAENLRLHWATTGRPERLAHLAEAVEVAGLGEALDRKVGSYSQGMRQRLAIARAVLGLPDLLVLDEPTNGLDPAQITRLREVLRRYATTGRTVLLSSHLLAEVEQTATHVVVVNRGRVLAHGPVAAVVADGGRAGFTVDSPERAAGVLGALPGVARVRVAGSEVHVDLGAVPRAEAVAALVGTGVAVDRAGPRHNLEDVFLRHVEEGAS
ncbi:alpha/beta fold hydrolase [Actinosynnema pretiosum]|uniref:alpha/beta fold hydrolase n=3 Tax=Actinosynnema TaxID=40566 RepID=UPI001E2BDECA|nr:alpha/beta fold hydrolase [Actinosynnema pretiosum]